jgi:hypothetical protein
MSVSWVANGGPAVTIALIAAPSPRFTGVVCAPARTEQRTGRLVRAIREYVRGELTGDYTILLRTGRDRASA